jgi:hypothetical protein
VSDRVNVLVKKYQKQAAAAPAAAPATEGAAAPPA